MEENVPLKDTDDVYTIVIIVLAVLTFIAGIVMIVVCSLFCAKHRGNLLSVLRLDQHPVAVAAGGTSINVSHRHSVSSVTDEFIETNDSDVLTGVVQLLELTENRDKIKIWRGSYKGSLARVKTFKPSLRDMWANERLLYSLHSTSACEYIQQYIGSQQKPKVSLYVLTEYHPLGSLCGFLQCNVLTVLQTLNIVHSMSSGLAHLHSNKYLNKESLFKKIPIAHRDIKSVNILVKDIHGHCVISDFSQAIILNPKATRRSLMNLNRKHKYMGTLQYMSPEALEGKMNLTDSEAFKQIDVYALSLVIWEVCNRCGIDDEILVGEYQLPFYDIVGEAPTLETMHKVAAIDKERPKLPDSWDTNKITKKLKSIMIESWDEDPEARLTAANIAGQLQELLHPAAARTRIEVDTEITHILPTDTEISTHSIQQSTTQHSEIIVSPSESS